MKSLKDLLKKAYEKKTKTYDEQMVWTNVLRGKEIFPSALRGIAEQLNIVSYRNKILTLSLPARFFSPEIHFHAGTLKEVLSKETKKPIRTLRILQQT